MDLLDSFNMYVYCIWWYLLQQNNNLIKLIISGTCETIVYNSSDMSCHLIWIVLWEEFKKCYTVKSLESFITVPKQVS